MQPSRDATSDVRMRTGALPRPRGPAPGDDRVATLESLVREHQAGVRAFLRAIGVNAASVDDLAQETFLVAYRKLDDRDPDRSAGPWLRGIARHLAANEIRKVGRRSRLIAGGLADLLIDRADPDRETPSEEWIEAMRACLRELPDAGRELLVRRYADGEPAEAMAARLQVRADALRQKLLRLRQAVKGCVERKTGMWR
ncbi:sigma-70 family RNA polymerase sigma factor [Paludisphaera rhizosphaerae]|uniref:sigma-70 family RNA polymerase sigma factor n=1 Tax=Paludisphaera rhizosphaerae TaxID=2711216 RepID=UPI001F117954|nr:sigma-70 family RNA polymerase sigma factor [Paludisphaera rhizosphaerae]